MSLYDKFFKILSKDVNDLKKLVKINDFFIKLKNLDDLIKYIQNEEIEFDYEKFVIRYNKYKLIVKNEFNDQQIEILDKNFNEFKKKYITLIENKDNEFKEKKEFNHLKEENILLNSILEIKNIANSHKQSLEEDKKLMQELNDIQDKNIKDIETNTNKLTSFTKLQENLGYWKLLKMFFIASILFIISISFIIFDRFILSWLN